MALKILAVIFIVIGYCGRVGSSLYLISNDNTTTAAADSQPIDWSNQQLSTLDSAIYHIGTYIMPIFVIVGIMMLIWSIHVSRKQRSSS